MAWSKNNGNKSSIEVFTLQISKQNVVMQYHVHKQLKTAYQSGTYPPLMDFGQVLKTPKKKKISSEKAVPPGKKMCIKSRLVIFCTYSKRLF